MYYSRTDRQTDTQTGGKDADRRTDGQEAVGETGGHTDESDSSLEENLLHFRSKNTQLLGMRLTRSVLSLD